MFTIEMLAASEGDSLWIEYGPDEDHIKRILIDAGRVATYRIIRERILELDENDRRFELFVITHVDSDHIEGAVPLLQDKIPGLEWGEVWFNGYRHAEQFKPPDQMGALQGEFVSALIDEAGIPWNAAFDEGPIVALPGEQFPWAEFDGGMKLTVLTPTPDRMRVLAAEWERVLEDEGLDAEDRMKTLEKLATVKKLQPDALGSINVEKLAEQDAREDKTVANGSTISLLAEYDGKTALLTGDVWAPVLKKALEDLNKERGTSSLSLDVLKVPHHGSVANMSKELLDQIRCKRYLFSSNGSRYGHPDKAGVARVIHWGGSRLKLYFNYRSEHNEMWDNDSLRDEYDYRTFYPGDGVEGLRVVV
ncbi:MAG TPA: hypothetical protein VEK79_21935 [Thermoanaerobaculia bacterium]|nr:hypothetical protein [Thermoanaerobaculia bacterium]